ncbi:prophage tail fiber N-terminal domain-containing protein [Escherichia coli]|uniref:prophage tail fiber N-terminal domain-containing protein n=1 Tax=Escherichia coli TaxID=562 RepID=UPI00198152AF|nr:prophage tail fiber N-terminal domain-containing protein [Escherichia coli]MBN6175817.1 prophage tail fiber N-terminal domain-containing protein [Escherichia coli]
MAVKISGVLKDGAGKPVVNCVIELRARRTSPTVVVHVVATCLTGSKGEYVIDAEPGYYDVVLLREGYPPAKAGEIYVAPTDEPDTLNAFLDAPKDGDLRPEVMKRFEEMVNTVIRLSEQVTADRERAETAADDAENAATSALDSKKQTEELKNQTQKSAEAAAESERLAEQHVTDAQQIKSDCETLANDVQKNAEAVAASKQQVEQLASQVEDTASEVRQDAEAAKKAASDAEQARDDIDVALSATLKTANHLSEIAAGGEDAQRESRDNLGLKSAATMDVQTDIYDRTEGRLAIPGAFGYGAIFRSEKSFSSENGPTEFVEWVKSTNPSQYAVTQYGSVNRHNPIIKGVVFTGIVDIKIPDTVASNVSPDSRTKVVTFYGVNGEVYHTRCAGSPLPEWGKLNLTSVDFAGVLSSRVAPTSVGNPDVGGLILAAYQGTADGDTNISMTRGYAYPGSSLTPLSISIPNDRENVATATPLITTRGCRGWSLPGVYIALNGAADNARGDSALVGLFVRAA